MSMSKFAAPLLLILIAAHSHAQPLSSGDNKPVLRVEALGPTSFVTSLAFSPDGNTLYTAGWDKVVRSWVRDPASKQFVMEDRSSYRIPIGPWMAGSINAMALSDDGVWLAVGGMGVVREGASFRTSGVIIPSEALSDSMRLDEGTIYVFDTRTGEGRAFRGHRGAIYSLAFAPTRPNKPPVLVSAGEDWNAVERKMVGAVWLWDVRNGAQLRSIELPKPTARPGLAVMHLGDHPLQTGVGLAWGDGLFRFWDAERQQKVEMEHFKDAAPVVYWPELRQFQTGEFQPGSFHSGGLSQLRAWRLLPNRTLSVATPVAFSFNRENLSAWAVEKLPPSRQMPPREVAVCVELVEQGLLQYSLRIFSAEGGVRPPARANAILWRAPPPGAQPPLAVSPKGDVLAVAGGPGHEILVYSIADLTAGRGEPQQRLRGVGQAIPHVAFARRGDDWGFVVSPRPKARPGELPRAAAAGDTVFDIAAGRLSTNLDGWTVSAPSQDNWRAELANTRTTPPQRELVLYEGQRLAQRIAIRPGHEVTDYAIVPKQSLLALATQIVGQPLLMLYDLPTGSPVRQLTGPSEKISCLSVSGDSRLLLAAAEDQTVSMWGLSDIRRANLPPIDANNGQPGAPSELLVMPAIDERKPLCTLFLTKPREGGPGWICWSPFGPFESSDRQVERYLGWHFNLFQPGKPALFSRADEYRQEYYQPGLLQSLVAKGELPAPVVVPPKPAPIMSLRVREQDVVHLADTPADVVVRSNRLGLEFRTFPLEPADLEQVTFTVDNAGEPQPMKWDAANRQWTADLSNITWTRGRRTVHIALRTREEMPQTFTHDATLRFQPPPPRIASALPNDSTTVDAAAFTFNAEVSPVDGQTSQTRLIHRHGDQTIAELDLGQQQQLAAPLTLQQGSNLIEVIATNRDALPGFEDIETARATWRVTFNPKTVPPPTIALNTWTLLPAAGQAPTAAQKIELGRQIDVSGKRIQIAGKIDAAEELETASIGASAVQPRALTGFAAGKSKTVTFNESLELLPGKQTITVRAKIPNSVLAEQQLVIVYQPPLPALALSEPTDQATFYAGEHEAEVLLKGSLAKTADPQPFTAAAFLNQRQLEPPTIDAQAGAFSAKVALTPGNNRIEVRLSNEWGQSQSQVISVRYLRPPAIVETAQPRIEAAPLTDVVFWAESPAELPITEASVNGRPVPAEGIVKENDRWKVTARAVPLVDGVNELRLQAVNEHGTARKPALLKVTYSASQPPVITLAAKEQTASSQRHQVRFAVRSSSALERVELLRGDEVVFRAADLARLKPDAQGWIDLEAEADTTLRRGINRLQVLAVNRTAAVKENLLVSYVPEPVRVVIDGVRPVSGNSALIPAVREPNGSLRFSQPAQAAEVALHGRVIWPDDADPTLEQPHSGRVWVNGFQQHTRIELQPREKSLLYRQFTVPVLLNAATNRIDIKLAGLPVEANDRLQVSIDCARPRSDQRLHLLIVGIGEKDEKALTERALRALQIETNARGELQKSGFTQVGLYRCLTGVVSPGQIFYQLGDICDKIERSSRDGTSLFNNVVILYYQGPEFVNRQGKIALATSFADPLRSSIEGNVLTTFVDAAPGAHVLLLDVARLKPVEPSDLSRRLDNLTFWDDDAHLGVLRYSWLRGTDTPPDARLLTALERALPQGSRFVEVESEVAKEFAQTHQKYPDAILYDKHMPSSLQDLIVGGLR